MNKSSILNAKSNFTFAFTALILVTLMQEYWWKDFDRQSLPLANYFLSIIIFMEALTLPSWIWTYLEIKKQNSYERIRVDPEQQNIRVSLEGFERGIHELSSMIGAVRR